MKRLFPAALFCAIIPALLHAQVILNEIMYYPDANEPEWVELYNAGTMPVTIEGWTIREDSNSSGSTPFSGALPAGGYLVITGDLQKFTERWGEIPSPVREASFSYLNNTGGDCVRLRGGEGERIDEVCYENSWGGRNGKSLERRSPDGQSGDSATWGSCIDGEKGTPGRANSILVSSAPFFKDDVETSLQIFPNPTGDYARIHLPDDVVAAGRRLDILDPEGRLIGSIPVTSAEMVLSLSDFPAGIYRLQLNEGKGEGCGEFLTVVR